MRNDLKNGHALYAVNSDASNTRLVLRNLSFSI